MSEEISVITFVVRTIINSGSPAGMRSNPRFIIGRKVESGGQQIIAIFIFLTPPSTVNSHQSSVISQQSTVNSQQ